DAVKEGPAGQEGRRGPRPGDEAAEGAEGAGWLHKLRTGRESTLSGVPGQGRRGTGPPSFLAQHQIDRPTPPHMRPTGAQVRKNVRVRQPGVFQRVSEDQEPSVVQVAGR